MGLLGLVEFGALLLVEVLGVAVAFERVALVVAGAGVAGLLAGPVVDAAD